MKILLLGGSGYVGSAVYTHLKDRHSITSWDLCKNDAVPGVIKDIALLGADEQLGYDAVILLAGHSSVRACEADRQGAFDNNVSNFFRLISRSQNQKFIYASSASVYGATGLDNLKETDSSFTPINLYDMTKIFIDKIAEHSCAEYYGLRFGTVNGPAPRIRTDVMINAMTHTALTEQHIKLFNGDVKRSILGIGDLCRAIQCIVEGGDYRGLYNLASFTKTSRQIAEAVSRHIGVPLREIEPTVNTNEKLCTGNYDFGINTDKFCRTYSFEFTDTIESITKGLLGKDGFNKENAA